MAGRASRRNGSGPARAERLGGDSSWRVLTRSQRTRPWKSRVRSTRRRASDLPSTQIVPTLRSPIRPDRSKRRSSVMWRSPLTSSTPSRRPVADPVEQFPLLQVCRQRLVTPLAQKLVAEHDQLEGRPRGDEGLLQPGHLRFAQHSLVGTVRAPSRPGRTPRRGHCRRSSRSARSRALRRACLRVGSACATSPGAASAPRSRRPAVRNRPASARRAGRPRSMRAPPPTRRPA